MRSVLVGMFVLMAGSVLFGQTVPTTAPTTATVPEMTEAERQAAEAQLETYQRTTLITLGVASLIAAALPVLVAVMRGHNNQIAIFLFAVFFGWTCIGWIVALIWAFSDNTRANDRRRYRR